MKFQCGRCGKNYQVDNTHTLDQELIIPCDRCGNSFSLDENLDFSSAGGNSKIICENCGQLVLETVRACPSCHLVLNKRHEATRIDNKEYAKIELQDGRLARKSNGGRKKGLPVTLVIITLMTLGGGGFWFLSTRQELLKGTVLEPIAEKMPNLSGREETQVVLMLDGTTYYAEKLEHDGPVLRITGKNGGVVEVAEKDVLDITTAVLE